MTRRGEEDEQQCRAVDAWTVEDIGESDEGDDEEGGGVCWDEEEGEPTVSFLVFSTTGVLYSQGRLSRGRLSYLLRQNMVDVKV